MCVARFPAISTTWFPVAATFARFVTFLVAFKALFVLIPALIGIVKLTSTTKTFSCCIWLLRTPCGSFGSFGGSLVTRLTGCSSEFSRALGFPFCRSRVFLSAVSIAVANSIAFLNSNWLSASNLRCMRSSFTPQTSRSRSIFSNWSPKSQCSDKFLSSATYCCTVSPCWRKRLLNLQRYTIDDGLGFKWFFTRFTSVRSGYIAHTTFHNNPFSNGLYLTVLDNPPKYRALSFSTGLLCKETPVLRSAILLPPYTTHLFPGIF